MSDLVPRQAVQCPVCAATAVEPVLALPQVPVLCNVLYQSQAAAQATPRGDIELVYCPACGHLFNAAYDPALVAYTQVYENSLHFSPRF
ncbi:MAG: methyltransferase, partial [Anaerolineae bacterium]|nr:methyltransferase [Anaerolineae bacterium]